MTEVCVLVDPDPRRLEQRPLETDEDFTARLAEIEAQVAGLRQDAYDLQLDNEVLRTQNRVLHDAHEEDRRTIVRLLREIEALKTDQPPDEL